MRTAEVSRLFKANAWALSLMSLNDVIVLLTSMFALKLHPSDDNTTCHSQFIATELNFVQIQNKLKLPCNKNEEICSQVVSNHGKMRQKIDFCRQIDWFIITQPRIHGGISKKLYWSFYQFANDERLQAHVIDIPFQ